LAQLVEEVGLGRGLAVVARGVAVSRHIPEALL
jgi:hypothetical protein